MGELGGTNHSGASVLSEHWCGEATAALLLSVLESSLTF